MGRHKSEDRMSIKNQLFVTIPLFVGLAFIIAILIRHA